MIPLPDRSAQQPRRPFAFLAPRAQGVTRELGLLIALVAVVACLVVFVLLPTAATLLFPSARDYAVMLLAPRFLKAALNSLFITTLSTVTATLFGFLFAYTAARTDVPWRRFFRVIAILPLFSPPFMVAFSYMMMFGKNGLLTFHLLGIRTNVFGWHGLWLSQTISFFPVAAVVIEGVLRSISPNVEYAGRNLGATGFRLFRTVTLPLARPGIAGAALLVSIQVLADFGNPIMIGGSFSVLATEAWLRVEGWGDVRGAAVLSSLLLVPSLVLFVAQRVWVGRRTYATLTGRAGIADIPRAGPVVRASLFVFCFLTSVLVILVYAALIMGAFVKGWGFDWSPTLRNLREVAARSPELIRSLVFAGAAGLASTLIAMAAAYIVSRKEFLLKRFIDVAAILPAALPGIFFGIGYSIVFSRPPLDLYGTAAIIVLSLVFWNVSIGYQSGLSAFSQISPSFGEAASNLGAGSIRIFREIEIPLIRGAFFSSFTVSFIRAATTLSVVVFLATSSNSVATFSIMNLVTDGFYGRAAALTTALLVVSFAALGAARLAAGRPVDLFKV